MRDISLFGQHWEPTVESAKTKSEICEKNPVVSLYLIC